MGEKIDATKEGLKVLKDLAAAAVVKPVWKISKAISKLAKKDK